MKQLSDTINSDAVAQTAGRDICNFISVGDIQAMAWNSSKSVLHKASYTVAQFSTVLLGLMGEPLGFTYKNK